MAIELKLLLGRSQMKEIVGPYSLGWVGKNDPTWQDSVRRQKREIRRVLLRRSLLGWLPQYRRGQKRIGREYDRQWRKNTFDKYAPPHKVESGAPWIWGDDAFFLTNEGGSRIRLSYLIAAINQLQPSMVLEIGCGNGINLLPLACRFPKMHFAGVEFTMAGTAALKEATGSQRLPDALVAFSPEPFVDSTAYRKVATIRASGGAIPFRDGSFDLVFTALALEQMEEIREAALREITRVSSRHVLMLEPFVEANNAADARDYIRAYDYFRGYISDLSDFGLKPLFVTTDMPSKQWLRTALVLCEKNVP